MMQVTQKILVTGATGRHGGTGAYVARRLREEGHSVRVLARTRDERSAALEAAGFEVHFGDLRERNSLLTAMEGIDQATFCFPVAPGSSKRSAIHLALKCSRTPKSPKCSLQNSRELFVSRVCRVKRGATNCSHYLNGATW
jgi:nucleoside-diphosphate-sugar epimerase